MDGTDHFSHSWVDRNGQHFWLPMNDGDHFWSHIYIYIMSVSFNHTWMTWNIFQLHMDNIDYLSSSYL
jgi:hypothetical protein